MDPSPGSGHAPERSAYNFEACTEPALRAGHVPERGADDGLEPATLALAR
jgi:hypothetical protein